MAALSRTAANVRMISGKLKAAVAGEALVQGDPIRDSGGKYYQTDANDTAKDDLTAVCISPGSADGDPIGIAKAGDVINIGATTVKGAIYYAGATAGSWHPAADVTTGWAVLPGLLARDTSGTCEVIIPKLTTNTIL